MTLNLIKSQMENLEKLNKEYEYIIEKLKDELFQEKSKKTEFHAEKDCLSTTDDEKYNFFL